jgi:hypothetical protein
MGMLEKRRFKKFVESMQEIQLTDPRTYQGTY